MFNVANFNMTSLPVPRRLTSNFKRRGFCQESSCRVKYVACYQNISMKSRISSTHMLCTED